MSTNGVMRCVIPSKIKHFFSVFMKHDFRDSKILAGVNTESCEQIMGWINKFTAVKAMNESRFFLFFVAIFDYHNLSTSGFLRSVVHPRSDHRWASLPLQDDVEPSLLMLKDEAVVNAEEKVLVSTEQDGELGTVVEELASLNLEKSIEKFKCDECGSEYKKPWTLKNHIKKKH